MAKQVIEKRAGVWPPRELEHDEQCACVGGGCDAWGSPSAQGPLSCIRIKKGATMGKSLEGGSR